MIWIVAGIIGHIVISMNDFESNEAIGFLLNSDMLFGGKSYIHIFMEPGTYIYCCKLHGIMMGTVIVLEVLSVCPVHSNVMCVDNKCGGCSVEFYLNGEFVDCSGLFFDLCEGKLCGDFCTYCLVGDPVCVEDEEMMVCNS